MNIKINNKMKRNNKIEEFQLDLHLKIVKV